MPASPYTHIAHALPAHNSNSDLINVTVTVTATSAFTYNRHEFAEAVRAGELREFLADAPSNLAGIDGHVITPDATVHPFQP